MQEKAIGSTGTFSLRREHIRRSKRVVRIRSLAFSSLTFCIFSYVLSSPACRAQSVGDSRVNVQLVTDEADAVLAILAKRNANQTLTAEDWRRLFSSEGYTRLKRRETSMQRSFTDEEFKAFVLSNKLAAS